MIELLFACGEDKVRPAVHTFQNPILKIWHGTILSKKRSAAIRSACCNVRLLNFPATFLPVSFASQCLLDPQFLARLQIEGMPLDLFNDVFLLHLAFEAPECVFQSFTILESYFCQNLLHLQTDHRLNLTLRN